MAITVNEINNKIITDGDSVKILAIAEQGPAGIGIGADHDEITIDLNTDGEAEIKGFELADDKTILHKRAGVLEFVPEGEAEGWRDELNDILKIQNSGTGFSVNDSECCVDVIQAANLSDYLFQNVQLNHDRDLTANIFPHMHFWQTQNLLPNFILDYRWQKKNGAKVTAWTRIPLNTLIETYTSGTLNQIATTESGVPVPVGTDISDIVQFRFYRDYGNASGLFNGITPHSGTMSLLSFDVHIKFDSLGSATQGAK